MGFIFSRASWLAFIALSASAAEPPQCEAEISRENLVACVQARSLSIAAELASLRSAEGRREAARPFLPSNPTLSGSLSSRTTPDARATNWSVTLAQELEVAGQSGLRVAAAEAELVSQGQQLKVVRAELAEQAWLAYFESLAAKERVTLAQGLERASLEVAKTAQAMADNGLSSAVDATVADAAAVSASQRRLDAQRAQTAATIRLRVLLGVQTAPVLVGALEPLRPAVTQPLERPELASLEALRQAAGRRVELLRRGRVPNPTLSAFVQNDGFDERVLGVGLGIPIPLPQPLGRTRTGEIDEAVGSAERVQAELERQTRSLAGERELAREQYEASLAARALYSAERMERAGAALTALAVQLNAARLSVREALMSQQALVELLEAEVDARQALCAASVRLIRTEGGSLEGGAL